MPKTDYGVESTNRSYHTLSKHEEGESGKDLNLISYLQPISQRSTIMNGKGVYFGKAKREILHPLRSKSPGPAKYDMPVVVKQGIKFGHERKSLQFSFPKLKDVQIPNLV